MSNVILELTMETGFVGAQHSCEVDTYLTREEWDKMTLEEKEDHIKDDIDILISENIYVSFKEVDNEQGND